MQDILNSYCVCICPFVNCWFIPFAYFFLDIHSVWCFTSYTYNCLCCWNTGTFSSWHQGNLTGAGILPNRRSYSSSHCLREHLSLVDHFPTISISFLLVSLVLKYIHTYFMAPLVQRHYCSSLWHCYSSLRCTGSSSWWLLLLLSMGSRCTGFGSCDEWT